MKRLKLKSELIKSMGHEQNVLEVEYTDGEIFRYAGVPFSTFKALLRSKHPGRDWLGIRDQYKFRAA